MYNTAKLIKNHFFMRGHCYFCLPWKWGIYSSKPRPYNRDSRPWSLRDSSGFVSGNVVVCDIIYIEKCVSAPGGIFSGASVYVILWDPYSEAVHVYDIIDVHLCDWVIVISWGCPCVWRHWCSHMGLVERYFLRCECVWHHRYFHCLILFSTSCIPL